MPEAYITYSNVVTPLALNLEDTYHSICQGNSGIQFHPGKGYVAALSETQQKAIQTEPFSQYHPAASAFIHYLMRICMEETGLVPSAENTCFILCSTKGDLEVFGGDTHWKDAPLARLSTTFYEAFTPRVFPQTISNACISGLSGLIWAQRLIQASRYNKVVVLAVDTVSDFVREGFGYLQAVSAEPCKPFDASRNGISLGEGAVLMVVENTPNAACFRVLPGAMSNDANHISGPSRDGSGLIQAILRASESLEIPSPDHYFISGHGTGTLYNDEMEAKAFHATLPGHLVFSALKGYLGHTLAASGLLELAIQLKSLRYGRVPGSAGFRQLGVSEHVAISPEVVSGNWTHLLKTGSGFGGSNAAVWIQTYAP